MQISKCFLIACAAAYCVALLPLRAADTNTDLKLRQALEKKLDDLQTPPSAAATPQPKSQAAPAPAMAPATQPPPAPAANAPAPADSENAAKARQALHQKMDDMQTPPAAVAPQSPGGRPTPPSQWPPPPTPKPSRQVAQPTPEPAPSPAPAPRPTPARQSTGKPVLTAPPPVDSETIAKAREALRKKMAEMETESVPASAVQPKAAVVPPAPAPAPAVKAPPAVAQPVPAPAPAVQAPPALAKPAPAVQVTPQAPPAADSDKIAKAREAMRQKMKDLDTQPSAAAPAVAPAAAKPAPEAKPEVAKAQEPMAKPEAKPVAEKPPKKAVKGAQTFPPIQGPPPTITADKQGRLAELLRKYRAEQVTPEEYHQQRAKILAEP